MKVETDKVDPMLGGTISAPTSLYSDDGRFTREIEGEGPPHHGLGETQQPVVEPTSEANLNQTNPDDIVKELLQVHRDEAEERERALKEAEDR